MVPGIDFSEDPLLQGRLFSYLDTQLSRLGSPNFHELPINAPKCPFANMQRDGHMQMMVPKGRANYEPNSIHREGPRETPSGFRSLPIPAERKVRERSPTFADHYSQARMFYRSVTPQEQNNIAAALAFELGKVQIVTIRKTMLGHLEVIDPALAAAVAGGLGMKGTIEPAVPAMPPIDMEPSPALRLYNRYKPTIKGRKVGILVATGFDAAVHAALVKSIAAEGGSTATVALAVSGVVDSAGKSHDADAALAGAPSVIFDAVCILAGEAGDQELASDPDAAPFAMDALRHLKAIGLSSVPNLKAKAGIGDLPGVIDLSNGKRRDRLHRSGA